MNTMLVVYLVLFSALMSVSVNAAIVFGTFTAFTVFMLMAGYEWERAYSDETQE